jgi:protease I
MPRIGEAKILILATNGFEQSELEKPLNDLKAKGATVHVASPEAGEIKGWDKKDWGRPVKVDLTLDQVNPEQYDAIVLPGGQINPDLLRVNKVALDIIRSFLTSGKIVAAVCHAPWLLVELDALKGRKATSYHSIRKDVENAGAHWVDQEVVADNGIVTSRNPNDLPAFVAKIVEEIEEGRHQRRAA